MRAWLDDAVIDPVLTFASAAPSLGQLWASRHNDLASYHAVLPSTVAVGESARLTVQAWDEYERLVRGHDATVRVEATDPDATTPDALHFPARADGLVRGDVRFETPGVHYVTVTDPEAGRRTTSNPVVVAADPDHRVYWGDLHLHSQFSDGVGSMANGFAFGRDVMALDVVAYTDHDTMGFFIPPTLQRWLMRHHNVARMKAQTARFHDPGEFVTLYAYEWTKQPGAGGHVNCYFDCVDDAPFVDSRHPESNTYEGLWRRLREWRERGDGDVVTVPHHPAEAMYPFDFAATEYDDELAPLVEVYSQWGSSECPAVADNPRPIGGIGKGEVDAPGHHVRDALAMGHRVGLVAGSDYHGPRPGHAPIHVPPHLPSLGEWVRDGVGWGNVWRVMDERSYPGGLTAFLAPELTREAVFDALRTRRAYGTTQPHRVLVRLAVDGQRLRDPDHEVAVPDADAERRVACWVAGSAPVDRVEVVKNGAVWRTLTPGGDAGRDDAGAPRATADSADAPDPASAVDPLAPPEGFDDHVVAGTVIDDAPVSGCRFDDERATPADYYYLRVRQADGGLAWAGPIWVSVDAG